MATKKTVISQGDKLTLTAPEGYGVGIGSVPTGTSVSVDHVYTEPIAGVGGSEGVLFSWLENGCPRSAHLPLADFNRLFKKDGK